MYYAHFILNKKGPLAKIWLAAHWDKKLTKAQIYETNIESTIETILEPQMKLALRTSGHLLLGVCRIYSRKVKYLLADCNEAFVKIKLAFRPGLIDLPKEKQQASVDAITLPEKFPEFYASTFTDINMEDMDLTKNLNQQARVEDITLKEDFGTYVAIQDDDFGGDMGNFAMDMDMDTFMMSDMERGRRAQSLSVAGGCGGSGGGGDLTGADGQLSGDNEMMMMMMLDEAAGDVGAGAAAGGDKSRRSALEQATNKAQHTDGNDHTHGELDSLNEMQIDAPPNLNSMISNKTLESCQPLDDMTMMHEDAMDDHTATSEQHASAAAMTVGGGDGGPAVVPTLFDEQATIHVNNATSLEAGSSSEPAQKIPRVDGGGEENQENVPQPAETATAVAVPVTTTTTVEKLRTRRRRKLIIDDVKEIDSATMKAQLNDTSGIVATLELAPPTRKLMELKETGGVDRLFYMTARPLYAKQLSKLYTRNMHTKSLAEITNNFNKSNASVAPPAASSSSSSSTTTTAPTVSNNNDLSNVEANMNVDQQQQAQASAVAVAESMMEAGAAAAAAEASKHGELTLNQNNNNTTNNQSGGDLDEFDQFGGPASIFANTNHNIEELLGDDVPAHVNLDELTATSALGGKEIVAADEEDEEEEDEEGDEEEEDDGAGTTNTANTNKANNKRSPSGKSPNRSKRAYRRSVATNKDNSTAAAAAEAADETLLGGEDAHGNESAKVLSKRAKTMVSLLNKSLHKSDDVGFFELTKRNGKKSVVQKFYSLLVLKKYDIIDVHQYETYGDIVIAKGPKFDTFACAQ